MTLTLQVGCDECEPIEWILPEKGSRVDPPREIVAIIVDFADSRGAFNIYDQGGGRIEKLGIEESGKRIIIPWRSTWWYYVAGSLRIGYVVPKQGGRENG